MKVLMIPGKGSEGDRASGISAVVHFTHPIVRLFANHLHVFRRNAIAECRYELMAWIHLR